MANTDVAFMPIRQERHANSEMPTKAQAGS